MVEQDGRPARFTWNGRVYGVRRIIDHWVTLRMDRHPGHGSHAPRRRHWRVAAGSALGVYELRHDVEAEQWLLARVWSGTPQDGH